MVAKDIQKKAKSTDKTTKREPTNAAMLKKVATISDTNKTLLKEIKVMSKIFGENQKVLVSMKTMIDTLSSTLENMQKQSKQIDMLEDDTQKIYAGLNHVRAQSDLVAKINNQTTKLEEEINRIREEHKSAPNTEELSHQIEDSTNSIRNNSQMIIKIAQRIDEVREDLERMSEKADSFLSTKTNIEKLESNIDNLSGKINQIEIDSRDISNIREEFVKITNIVKTRENIQDELDAIKITIDSIASSSLKIEHLKETTDELKQQFDTIYTKISTVDQINAESIKQIDYKIGKFEEKLTILGQKADASSDVGHNLKLVQEDLTDFKKKVYDRTNSIEQKISSVNDSMKKQDFLSEEFQKKADRMVEEIQYVKEMASNTSTESSKEIIVLLKLSEYQSNIRMLSESKYGDIKDLENMTRQTLDINKLFDKTNNEISEKIPLPHEVIQWAISKIIDCADRWEIRFSDLLSILTNELGKDTLKEMIKLSQVRDIYGIRAVDEIRRDVGIS